MTPQIKQAFEFIAGDFETAWAAVSGIGGPANRGNFMFFRQALLLWALASEISGSAHDLHTELNAIDPRYGSPQAVHLVWMVDSGLGIYLDAPPFDVVGLTGADHGRTLPPDEEAVKEHLTVNDDGLLRVRVDVLYRDLKAAIKKLYFPEEKA